MAKILNKFAGKTVTVSQPDNTGVEGVLTDVDNHGVLIVAETDAGHEINEKVAVYIPHKDIKMIHANEDKNTDKEIFSTERHHLS